MQKTAAAAIAASVVGGVATAVVAGGLAAAGTLGSPGCLAGGEPATVASVDDALDLHLADGRIVHLAGIRPAETGVASQADATRGGLERWLTATAARVAPLRPVPDRWGRTVALVFASPGGAAGETVSVGEALLEAGQATAAPEPALEACWPTYLNLEATARQARTGAWATGQLALDPADRPGLTRALGSWALVQGVVGAVRDGRARTYVRFRDDAGSGFALAIDHATARRLLPVFGDLQGWVGRRVLARGLLDDRWGLQIDIGSAQQISVSPP